MNKKLGKGTGKISTILRISCLFFLFGIFSISNISAAGDTKKPVMDFLDDTEVGPVVSDTIIVRVQEENPDIYQYKFITDGICQDGTIGFTDFFDSEVPIVIDTMDHNGEKICFKALDLSGNRQYLLTTNPLNITNVDSEAPIITLNGSSNQTVQAGGIYVDEGADYYDNLDGTGTIFGVGFVDMFTLGTYTLTYDITDFAGNIAVQVVRTINVVDTTLPVLTILGDNPVTVEYGDEYIDFGTDCIDSFDGPLPVIEDSIIDMFLLGEQELYFYCQDLEGNDSDEFEPQFRIINVVDTTAPEIILLGTGEVIHEMGTVYTDDGAEYSDLVDGNGTIVGSGIVDVNTVGIYTLTYDYTDTSGNIGLGVSRNITVVDTIAPNALVITSPSEGGIINTNTPTVVGTGDVGDTIDLTIGVDAYTGVVDGAGNWSINITNILPESNNAFQVTETDPNLNISLVTLVNFVVSTSIDTDLDGVPDSVEIAQGTNPTSSGSFLDTDLDGITDFIDINDDGDSLDDWIENAAPNSGDLNNDGILDSAQGDVATLVSEVTNDYVSLDATAGTSTCSASSFEILSEANLAVQDGVNDYPVGLNDFTLNCATVGTTVDIKVYYDKIYDTSAWVYNKYNTLTDVYTDISSIVTYTIENVGGVDVTVVSYSVTDGGAYDEDGIANGVIVDPSGPAVDPTPIPVSVCGEGIGSWAEEEEDKKIKIKSKKLKKRINFTFLKKRYKKEFLDDDDHDENDDVDEDDDINEEEQDYEIGNISYSELVSLINTKYNQCYDKDGLERFIPKVYKKKIDKLLGKLGDLTDNNMRLGIILISYSRLENMKNNSDKDKLINLINYLQMKLAIEYFS